MLSCFLLVAGTSWCKDDPAAPCAQMASDGFCQYAAAKMLSSCPATCNKCPMRPDHPCYRDNATALVTAANEISASTDRMLHDFPEFGPSALSRDPPVIKYDSFVNAREAKSLISLCEPQLNKEASRRKPSATSMDAQHRVVETCMCTWKGCTESIAVIRLLARILMVTNAPAGHAEPLQIVRYTADGYFRSHHDMADLPHTPQGSRLWSVLVYLSTPDEGGGTAFTDLGIDVEPVLGTALVWASMSDADPAVPELRSHHEGLRVTSGVKWIVNVRIHQHNYLTPLSRGCSYAAQPKYSIEYLHNSLAFYYFTRAAAGLVAQPKARCEEMAYEGLTAYRPRLVMYDRLGSACDARPSYCCIVGLADHAARRTQTAQEAAEIEMEQKAAEMEAAEMEAAEMEAAHQRAAEMVTASYVQTVAQQKAGMEREAEAEADRAAAAQGDSHGGSEGRASAYGGGFIVHNFGNAFVVHDTGNVTTAAWEVSSSDDSGDGLGDGPTGEEEADPEYTVQAALVNEHWEFNVILP